MRRLALCLLPAVAIAGWAPLAGAQNSGQTAPQAVTQNSPENAVFQALLAGGAGGQSALQSYLSAGGGGSEGVASRAVTLLSALQNDSTLADPAQAQALAVAVSNAVDDTLNSAPVLGAQMAATLTLSPNDLGFDFGTPDAAPTKGFQKVTTRDARLVTSGGRALRRPDGALLQADGVQNVKQFQTGVPNGRWRLVLMTDDLGADQGAQSPFGSEIRLNDRTLRVAGGNPSQWVPGAVLGQGPSQGEAGGRGGIVQTEVTVSNGRLVIDFGSGAGTYLTGIVLQPIDEPNIVQLTGEVARYYQDEAERVARARAAVAEALGAVLTRVATAAGPIQLGNALQANQVVNQPTALVSEN